MATKEQIRHDIEQVAAQAEGFGFVVAINDRLPYVGVDLVPDEDEGRPGELDSVWFAQGEEAQETLDEIDAMAEQFNTEREHCLLYKLDSAGVLSDFGF